MTTSSPKVDLTMVWRWDCPTCACRNYHNGARITEEDRNQLKEAVRESELDEAQQLELIHQVDNGGVVALPKTVFCSRCETKFPVQDPDDYADG